MFEDCEDEMEICWDCGGLGYYDDEEVDEEDCTCDTCWGEGWIDA